MECFFVFCVLRIFLFFICLFAFEFFYSGVSGLGLGAVRLWGFIAVGFVFVFT